MHRWRRAARPQEHGGRDILRRERALAGGAPSRWFKHARNASPNRLGRLRPCLRPVRRGEGGRRADSGAGWPKHMALACMRSANLLCPGMSALIVSMALGLRGLPAFCAIRGLAGERGGGGCDACCYVRANGLSNFSRGS